MKTRNRSRILLQLLKALSSYDADIILIYVRSIAKFRPQFLNDPSTLLSLVYRVCFFELITEFLICHDLKLTYKGSVLVDHWDAVVVNVIQAVFGENRP